MVRRYYAPNMEPDVVLKCGCITSAAFAIKHLGTPGEWQFCDTHPNGEGWQGAQKILREASVYERIAWREYGTPAPKRRSSRAPKWLSGMPGQSNKAASTEHGREPDRLF